MLIGPEAAEEDQHCRREERGGEAEYMFELYCTSDGAGPRSSVSTVKAPGSLQPKCLSCQGGVTGTWLDLAVKCTVPRYAAITTVVLSLGIFPQYLG
jgi:hypothetical protein